MLMLKHGDVDVQLVPDPSIGFVHESEYAYGSMLKRLTMMRTTVLTGFCNHISGCCNLGLNLNRIERKLSRGAAFPAPIYIMSIVHYT
ncbi:hypothetical protein [Paenibacillus sp. MABNR03]|uniref:hypothetical protein n=1 Tax=Paenibacillus sp. MABNR03 TaxID=3142626 RepID=UPI003D2AAFAC